MASIYDRTELYDLFDTPDRQAVYREHWHTLFAGKQVHTMLDVSIGSGNVTLPALELNVSLCGSDLSEPMLTACAQKLDSRGLAAELHQADFRELSIWAGRQFDFVVSSGSSLGYVENADVARALGITRQEAARLFDLAHPTKIDALSKALEVLGAQLDLSLALLPQGPSPLLNEKPRRGRTPKSAAAADDAASA